MLQSPNNTAGGINCDLRPSGLALYHGLKGSWELAWPNSFISWEHRCWWRSVTINVLLPWSIYHFICTNGRWLVKSLFWQSICISCPTLLCLTILWKCTASGIQFEPSGKKKKYTQHSKGNSQRPEGVCSFIMIVTNSYDYLNTISKIKTAFHHPP